MYGHELDIRVRPDSALKAFSEAEAALTTIRLRCSGAAKAILERCKPCRCSSSQWKYSYLWHNYRPLQKKMEDIIMHLVKDMKEAPTIVVTATASLIRFVENENAPMCKDQFLRMISVAVCVNAKFWDDEQAGLRLNERIAASNCIPLDEFNMMEIAFMRGLGWNVHCGAEEFAEWVTALEEPDASSDESVKLQALRRNPSPHSSTDLVEGFENMLSDFRVVSFGAGEGKKLGLVESGVEA